MQRMIALHAIHWGFTLVRDSQATNTIREPEGLLLLAAVGAWRGRIWHTIPQVEMVDNQTKRPTIACY